MRKLFLVALCSTSLLSVARAEDTFGSRNALGDAMKPGDDTGRAGSMAPDSTQAHRKTAKKAKKQGADTPMKHDGMDHGSMKHDGMDHGSMKHDGMDHGSMKHDGMDHGSMQHDDMDHGSMQHDGQRDSGTR